MSFDSTILAPEDYEEPRCLLRCDGPAAIPRQRIAEKLDEYMSRRDYAGAERHLLYWMAEAEMERDLWGQLFLCGELAGHYRKVSDREKALLYVERTMDLLDLLKPGGATEGTALVNAATACSAFGENERALDLFRRAEAAYGTAPETGPRTLGGLYNNMGLACAALNRFEEAFELYERAMEAMGQVSGGELEQAVTCLNMADAVEAEQGPEAGERRIAGLLDRAYALLQDTDAPRDGYYAFVCEKCAPGFSYYGYFAAAEELRRTAERIYERT